MSKKKMKLQELDDALIFVRSNLQNEKDKTSDNYKLYSRQLQKLEEIDAYVSSYEWVSKSQEVQDKIKFIRESGYDYELCRRELNLSAEALKSLVKRANKSFVKKVGETTIDLIISRNNTIGLGMTQFGVCSGKYNLSEILNSDFYDSLPEGKVDFFDIFDCIEEIKVMYMFSRFGMQEMLSKCNPKKIALLRYILENPTERYAEAQRDLISVLLGVNIDLETYLDNLEYLKAEKLSGSSNFYSERMVEPFESNEENEEDFVSLSDSLDDDFVPLSEDFFEGFDDKSSDDLDGFVSLLSDKDLTIEEIVEEADEDEVLEDL